MAFTSNTSPRRWCFLWPSEKPPATFQTATPTQSITFQANPTPSHAPIISHKEMIAAKKC
ncbi:hypothetical protein [Neisseria animaloris]|uniref:hypothetical protein n=1 Tax=Neisseria animaloris TaxID=326522 RepID=UPI0039E1F605